MAAAAHSIRVVYRLYAGSLLAICGASLVVAMATVSITAAGQFLAAGWILAGIAWVVGGFLAAPRVATYLGPGGGVMLWGAASPAGISPSLRPESSRAVLADLGEKLSRGTDLAALLAILGVLLLLAGALASVDLWLGFLAGAAILVLIAILMRTAARGSSRAHPG